MYGRTEAESSGPREGLKPLGDLARQLVPRPDDVAIEEKGGAADGGAPQRQLSLAPWASARSSQELRRDIVLVQGPAGSGKSLFAWSLYSRFGQPIRTPPYSATCACLQTPQLRPRTR